MRNLRRKRNNKNKTAADNSEEFRSWFEFFSRNDQTRNILRETNPLVYSECKEFENTKECEKENEKEVKDYEIENQWDECVCDYDVNCQFCASVAEAEKSLQQQYKWTYEDEAAENEVYKMIKKELGKEKRQEIVRKSRIPIAPLPEKELCEYEKIRKDNIAQ